MQLFNSFEVVSADLRRVRITEDSKATQIQSRFSFIDYQELRMFQISYIPGPLQSLGYIRGIFRADIFSLLEQSNAEQDMATAIDERVRQGQKLRDSSKQFDFIIHENAFRSRICSREQMIEQIESIKAFSNQPNIRVSILPFRLNYLVLDVEPPQVSFDVFDSKLLILQGNVSAINVWHEELITGYKQYFEKLKAIAISNESLLPELDRITSELE
ncbi:MAG: Scr1 family TA system antitoxin-like transcriptional regulator [Leptolyngbyaceae cyanobacterium bins.302]|nr:Scr1 family TA system antitoxin-like transcriptional regulator [Leptolyngbyaceae cyanobacterium bins.302]